MAAYYEMPYDAVALTAKDLSGGLDLIERSLTLPFPWVSANITDLAGSMVVPAFTIKEIAGVTIGIIGLTGVSPQAVEGFFITDWRVALATQIDKINSKCDMLVVLSNLSKTENKALSNEFQNVDIVISTTGSNRNLQPRLKHNTLITQAESRGKYLGKLQIEWHRNGTWFVDPAHQSVQVLEKRLGAIDTQIEAMKMQQEDGSTAPSQKLARMKSYRKNIAAQIESAERARIETNQKVQNTFTSSFIPIIPTSVTNEVAAIVSATKEHLSQSK